MQNFDRMTFFVFLDINSKTLGILKKSCRRSLEGCVTQNIYVRQGLGREPQQARNHPFPPTEMSGFCILYVQMHCLHRNLYYLFSPEFPIDYRNQRHRQNRIQRQAHIQDTEHLSKDSDQIKGAQVLIEFQ